MGNTEKLMSLRRKIENTEKVVSEAVTRRKVALERLKEEFKCGSVEEGKATIKKLEEKAEKYTKKIEKELGSIEEELDGFDI